MAARIREGGWPRGGWGVIRHEGQLVKLQAWGRGRAARERWIDRATVGVERSYVLTWHRVREAAHVRDGGKSYGVLVAFADARARVRRRG